MKPYRKTPRLGRRGSALIASLISVMVVATMGAAILQLNGSLSGRQELGIDTKRALYLAEAGLSEAYIAVAQGKSGAVGTPEVPARFGDGVYWVTAEDFADGRVQLRSTGLCGRGRIAIDMILLRELNPLAALGAFGGADMVLEAGSVVDGYDSRLGPYEEQLDPSIEGYETTGQGGQVTSNGDVSLEGSNTGMLGPESANTRVFGDASPGPLGAVNLGAGTEVTGTTLPLPSLAQVAEIEVPEHASVGSYTHNDPGAPLMLGKRDRHYESLTIGARSKAILVGPVSIVADTFVLESGAELEFDSTQGPVTIFVPAFLNFRPGSILSSVDRDPRRVAILTQATEAVLASEGEFFGMLYAPNAALELPAGLRTYGLSAAERLTLASQAHFSIDRGTLDSVPPGLRSLPAFLSWRLAELPDEPLVRSRLEPLAWLSAQGTTPTPSPDAHLEKYVRIVYRGFDGEAYAYSGLDSAFDWTLVKRPMKALWAEREEDFADWQGFEDYDGADTAAAEGASMF